MYLSVYHSAKGGTSKSVVAGPCYVQHCAVPVCTSAIIRVDAGASGLVLEIVVSVVVYSEKFLSCHPTEDWFLVILLSFKI